MNVSDFRSALQQVEKKAYSRVECFPERYRIRYTPIAVTAESDGIHLVAERSGIGTPLPSNSPAKHLVLTWDEVEAIIEDIPWKQD